MRYKNWEEQYLSCYDEKEKQALIIRLQDMLEQDLKKDGTCYESILAKEGIDIWKFLPNYRKKYKFKRTCPPLKWQKGLIKPSKKLAFTNKMLLFWGEHKQDIYFSKIENNQYILLAGTRGLKIPNNLFPYFVSNPQESRLDKQEIKSITGRYYAIRAKAREAKGIIDFIPSLERVAGEAKRLHKSFR